MRLLNCRTRELEEYVGEEIELHPYAILSHTWGEEEVVFSDITQGNTHYTAKKGWYKVEKTCQQALQDGYDYVWADTVCIDKSSSAELSEAINSMFKWYRGAAICYAYLCDLPEVPFRESRWFTRGWTLQEMIAPEQMRFYDRHWNFRGAKSDLLETLEEITGVDTNALRGGNLRFFSVARKMSWASKRNTSREEDTAYCLLGIFDITMPLLYGEGARAFYRLQEEIIKGYEDESLFAW
ncbi:HET-domain-containing protein, partial [Thozetella sp. PMI_491]